MPKVSQEYRDNRRRAVVGAATDCFLAEGYRGASMHEIIAATGLSAGAIYNHFPRGKSELVAACAQTGLDQVFDLAQRRVAQPFDPESWLVGVLEELAAQPRLARLLLITWGEAAVDEGVNAALGSHLEALRSLVDEQFAGWAVTELGLSRQDATQWVGMFSQAVLSVLQGWVVQSQLMPGFAHEAYLDYARTIAAVGD
ncbi:TetR/AcrR family transcriptional regulator [Kocuria soli]|uniref:TetR/AcrR family transcriptional regulator n=1 Tax=Kocuria soli TaxID=2485125 RepID=A0A3N3ZPB7_9MICC|nr:TetR/AcrR family transcriptional regulator [Kocuria soli]ROZ61931.1 TetR/AcrR family transcriptional regulator [Kocuria soli]